MRVLGICILLLVFVHACDAQTFDHNTLDQLLLRAVDKEGRVDYDRLKSHVDLISYVKLIAEISPNTHPTYFPQRADSLAFWINVYNALVLFGVAEAYPVVSVTEIAPDFGFFKKRLFVVGGQSFTLDHIEHEIIRKEFGDPRIHAALNCAAKSCPPLQSRAYMPGKLDDQLNDAMRNMVRSAKHVEIDRTHGVLKLSSIFNWFSSDFISSEKESNTGDALVMYVQPFLPVEARQYLQQHPGIPVHFLPYDWSLNDQRE